MNRKNIITTALFVALMVFTFWIVFKGNNLSDIRSALMQMNGWYVVGAAICGLFFVSAEGIMIWYLLRALGVKKNIMNCIRYSFIGFFFSGITPSATGGQPVQLYCMSKEKIKAADSTVVLMTVAVIYKFVLVLIGLGILLFWHQGLVQYLGQYRYLYYFGLFLNVIVTMILVFVMVSPTCFKQIVGFGEKILVKLHILKPSKERGASIEKMASDYHMAVEFFMGNKKHIVVTCLITFIQRISVFFITYIIYRGWNLGEYDFLIITLLQGSVYVAVDMLPLPGSQGISEMMYQTVFASIFTGSYMAASVCVTRGISFYFVLIISALFVCWWYMRNLMLKKQEMGIKKTVA